jgi:hypothetical protein
LLNSVRLRRIVLPKSLRMFRHGWNAPRAAERIWVRPAECVSAVGAFNRKMTGDVVGGDWDLRTEPVAELPKVRMARLHWQDGVSWRDAGAYDYMMQRIAEEGPLDDCETLDDVIARYERLDEIFEQVKRDGRFRTQTELRPGNIRERGGVYVHIGRRNTPIFGVGGCHRLAMAQILGFTCIPAQLGVVHSDALASWRSFCAADCAPADAARSNP